jgi:general secretion pathway protein E
MSDELTQLVISRADSGTIKKQALDQGMRTLRDDGAFKVLKGITSLEEVIRVTTEEA